MIERKRSGVVAVAVILAGLAGAGGYAYYAYTQRVMQATRVDLPPLPRIPPVPAGAMAEMDRLQPRLARLAVPTAPPPGAPDLGLFGYRPGVRLAGAGSAEPSSPGPDDFPRHVVSMAFVSPGLALCVVDGALRRPGERLDNGTRVVRIAPGRVLLEWEGIEEWFEVSNPPVQAEEEVAS